MRACVRACVRVYARARAIFAMVVVVMMMTVRCAWVRVRYMHYMDDTGEFVRVKRTFLKAGR